MECRSGSAVKAPSRLSRPSKQRSKAPDSTDQMCQSSSLEFVKTNPRSKHKSPAPCRLALLLESRIAGCTSQLASQVQDGWPAGWLKVKDFGHGPAGRLTTHFQHQKSTHSQHRLTPNTKNSLPTPKSTHFQHKKHFSASRASRFSISPLVLRRHFWNPIINKHYTANDQH